MESVLSDCFSKSFIRILSLNIFTALHFSSLIQRSFQGLPANDVYPGDEIYSYNALSSLFFYALRYKRLCHLSLPEHLTKRFIKLLRVGKSEGANHALFFFFCSAAYITFILLILQIFQYCHTLPHTVCLLSCHNASDGVVVE